MTSPLTAPDRRAEVAVPIEVLYVIRERAERLVAHLHLAGGAYEHEAQRIIEAVNNEIRNPDRCPDCPPKGCGGARPCEESRPQ